jgi:hypothetical protein
MGLKKQSGLNSFTLTRNWCASQIYKNLNALFINESVAQHERLVKLNTIAIHQMKLLTDTTGIRKIRGI